MSLVYSPNTLGSSSSGGNWYISTLPCLRSLMAGSCVKKRPRCGKRHKHTHKALPFLSVEAMIVFRENTINYWLVVSNMFVFSPLLLGRLYQFWRSYFSDPVVQRSNEILDGGIRQQLFFTSIRPSNLVLGGYRTFILVSTSLDLGTISSSFCSWE